MLAFLFHRKSIVPKCVEGMGLILLLYQLLNRALSFLMVHVGLLLIIFLLYAMIRFKALRTWYPNALQDAGIGLHFARGRVACAYILAVSMVAYAFSESALALIAGLALLGFFVYVNGVLTSFHLQDRDPLPVNYYSSGAFLRASPGAQHDA